MLAYFKRDESKYNMIIEGILELHTPKRGLPVIFDSPHSGQNYPEDFNYACDFESLRRIEDTHVDDLFMAAPDHGATLLRALFPRSYIDVNRAADDIDDLLLKAKWPQEHFGVITPSARSRAGIGLIPRLVKAGRAIYTRPLSAEEIMNRVKNYYEPYHDTLCTTLNDAYYNHGQFWHINCHSMPNASAYPKKAPRLRPSDIVLGDHDGKSCSRDFMQALRKFWEEKGYRVTINDPFKGVELASRYAWPTQGKNSVQIEINRALYMNEETGEKLKTYDAFKSDCTDMIKMCCDFARNHALPVAAD